MPETTQWKVLVVEDRAGITASLLRSRADFDIGVVHRLTAVERQIREQPSSEPYQAILLDLALADLADPQGVDAYRRVRSMAPGLPIIVLAPSYADDVLPAVAAEGAYACLPRPSSTVEVLAWTLRQAVLRSRAEARRFRDLFDSVPMGILLAAGRRVAMANPAALRNLGYSEEDLSRLSAVDLFPAALRPDLESALDASVAGEARESSFSAALIRKDGTPAAAQVFLKGALLNDAPALALYLAFTPAPIEDARIHGIPSGTVTGEDIFVAEDSAGGAYGAPGLPAGFPSPLAGSRPRAGDGHPGRRLEALGRLAGSIAHDFNNLFTAINGYSDHLLGLPGVEGPMERGLRAIRRAGDAAAAMTRGLMAFCGSGSGESVAIKVDAGVDDAAPMLSSLLGGALRLSVRQGAGRAAARLEPGQLEQVLLNLCANAKEAMPRGGTVALSTEIAASAEGEGFSHLEPRSAGPFVVITVRDTGVGMAGDVMERLFEPNFTTKAGPKGKGYGLAEVYGIVGGAGGGLSVSSRPGQGSVFRVWLPRADAVAAAGPASIRDGGTASDGGPRVSHADVNPTAMAALHAAYPKSDSAVPGGPGEGAEEILGEDTVPADRTRILVVEDEPSLREMLRAVLERYGYEVEEAVSGGDAEDILEHAERLPDLVITDVLLRDGLGTEMAARLRGKHPALRFLFISGHSLDTLADQGIRIAGTDFLEKPFTPSQLSNKAKAALSPQQKPA